MKKILFGCTTSILSLIGFSSYRSTHKTLGLYYWFSASPGKEFGFGNYPQAHELTYLGYTTTPLSLCIGGSLYYCLIGYTRGQVQSFSHGIPQAFYTTGRGDGIATEPWVVAEWQNE